MNLIELLSVGGVLYFTNQAMNSYFASRGKNISKRPEFSESQKNEYLQAIGRNRRPLTEKEKKSLDNLKSMWEKEMKDHLAAPQYPTTQSFQFQLSSEHLTEKINAFRNRYKTTENYTHGVLPGTVEEKCSPFSLTREERDSGIVEIWRNKEGQYHREDGPAVIYASGAEEWYWEDKFTPGPTERHDNKLVWRDDKGDCHREYGPAILYKNGKRTWCQNGEFHRVDGPAIIHRDRSEEWWWEGTRTPAPETKDSALVWKDANGDYHRNHGPAIISKDGNLRWYKHGKRHRVNGPAVVYSSGIEFWYWEGNKTPAPIRENNRYIWENENGQFHREHGPAIVYNNGKLVWYKNNKRHRVDGPAVIYADGEEKWYWEGNQTPTPVREGNRYVWRREDGQLHREHGPAIVYDNGRGVFDDGRGVWYKHNKRHRVDGPAVVCVDGTEQWYWEGNQTPAPVREDIRYVWRNEIGEAHREHGPAIVYDDGRMCWYKNNKRHREDGPAIICSDEEPKWYLNGKEYSDPTTTDDGFMLWRDKSFVPMFVSKRSEFV